MKVLYSAQLKTWREELNNSGIEQLSKKKPRPTSKLTAEQKQIEKLQAEVSRLNRELEITNGCLDLQKNNPRAVNVSLWSERNDRCILGLSWGWAVDFLVA